MSETDQKFITSYESSVPNVQKKLVDSLIEEKRRQGFIITKGQRDAEIEVKYSNIGSKFFNYEDTVPLTRISSTKINTDFENIFLDLKTLYAQLAVLSSNKSKITAISNDTFIKTRAAINTLINQLRLFRFLKSNPEYQDAKYISFTDSVNRTSSPAPAVIDTKSKKLKLALSSDSRFAVGRFNLDRTEAEVNHYGGGISGSNQSFSITNTLDPNPETFWAQSILVDTLPSFSILLSHNSNYRKLASGTQNGHVYESNGIVFDITYKFYKTINTNNIRLQPIADYPVRVLDIAYKTSTLSSDWITIPDFDPANYQETLDWIEWNGPRIHLTDLRVVIEQQNYTTNIYHIPSDLISNNQLWTQIVDKSYDETVHNLIVDEVIADKIQADPNLLTLLNAEYDLSNEIMNQNMSGKRSRIYDVIERTKNVVKQSITKEDSYYDGKKLFSNAPLVEVKKLQYICGLRSIEVNDYQYEPFGFYESQKFDVSSNPLEVSIETDEEHRYHTDGVTGIKFKNTSIEYELELGSNIVIPIAPSNNIEETDYGSYVSIVDEVLLVNGETLTALTRFYVPSFDSNVIPVIQIRKNGNRYSPLILNSTVTSLPKYNYTSSYITIGDHKYIKIIFNRETYDPRSVYTISYSASEDAAVIDINNKFDSNVTPEPEVFSSTDKQNKISLKYFPYIEYSIINNENLWRQQGSDQAWEFVPALSNYTLGRISFNTGDPYTITGNGTFWEDGGIRTFATGSIYGLTGASIQIVGDTKIYPISGVLSNSGIILSTPIDYAFLPSGVLPTGMQYIIGKTVTIDNVTYGLSNTVYEPIKVYVNDVKATNMTDYTTLHHNAFIPQDTTRIFEYIQAGKNVYFNASINGSIEVVYSYMSEYIKVNALLRNHSVVNPTDTPVLSNILIKIKDSKI